jgi:murein DD-endopeptidase MepM/ murein hydrolase activator NlpD
MISHLHTAQNWIAQHPRHIMAGVAALLLGTGITAFGVAPLEAQIDDMPLRQLVEPIEPSTQLGSRSLEAPVPFVLHRSDTTLRFDTTASLLQRLGVSDTSAQQFLSANPIAAQLLRGPSGKLVTAEANDNQQLLRLVARWVPSESNNSATPPSHYQRLVVERTVTGFVARTESAEFNTSLRMASGTIRTSLFAATDAARLPDSVASQLADLFSSDIDFRRDLRQGDTFSVVYEALEADGELLRFGRMISAQFINNGRTHQAMWFQEPGQRGGYYTLDGESMRRAFLASPLAFSRVSSGYGMRFHPVHGDRRPHLGVDYAAPTGTPVRSVADGVVSFVGRQGGYGNVVFIQHRDNKVTVYAHLSRMDVRNGQRVSQGDNIGAVGCTGTCTGPHLHFEYRHNGRHLDPLILARDKSGEPISRQARAAFTQAAAEVRQQLAQAATSQVASAE